MRTFLWLAFVCALVLLLVWLANSFPGQITDENGPYLVGGIAWAALVAAGLIFSRRIKSGEVLRNIAIWAAVAVMLLLGFTFQDELRNLGLRLRSELIPAAPVETGDHVMVLTAGQNSHFFVFGKANDTPVKFLIDTGASDVVLSPGDARRLGIDLDSLRFTHVTETANGLGSSASYTLRSLSIGPIARSNVGVLVNKSEMRESLLGMMFLRDLASVEIRGRQLFLRWNSVP